MLLPSSPMIGDSISHDALLVGQRPGVGRTTELVAGDDLHPHVLHHVPLHTSSSNARAIHHQSPQTHDQRHRHRSSHVLRDHSPHDLPGMVKRRSSLTRHQGHRPRRALSRLLPASPHETCDQEEAIKAVVEQLAQKLEMIVLESR